MRGLLADQEYALEPQPQLAGYAFVAWFVGCGKDEHFLQVAVVAAALTFEADWPAGVDRPPPVQESEPVFPILHHEAPRILRDGTAL